MSLPSASSASHSDTPPTEEFPLVVSPPSTNWGFQDTLGWIQAHREATLEQLNQIGAILLRGFDVADSAAFDQLVNTFDLPAFTYETSLSNAVRVNVTDRVFTANEAPPSVEIFLHHEMAQTPRFPGTLFFFCETACTAGGATPLCRSDTLLARLTEDLPDFVARCADKGVRYSSVMPGDDDAGSGQGRSWRSTLSVTDRGAAEQRLRALGYAFEWLAPESLRVTTPVLPALRTLKDGRTVFFNQLIAAYRGWNDTRNDGKKALCYGDGSAMEEKDLAYASMIADQLACDVQWQAGDVALVDNFLVMHGRRPFEGKRRVLVALGDVAAPAV